MNDDSQSEMSINTSSKAFKNASKSKKIDKPDEFEILQRFNAEASHYDKSNLPPVILPAIPSKMRANKTDSRLKMETIIIQNLIQSYFEIVKKNIADLVPKTIMAFLVNESKSIA